MEVYTYKSSGLNINKNSRCKLIGIYVYILQIQWETNFIRKPNKIDMIFSNNLIQMVEPEQ